MNSPEKRPVLPLQDAHDQSLATDLRKLDKKDWWIWGNSILIMLLLTGALITFALPSILQGATALFHIKFGDALFGLVGFIILFNVYTIYQQMLIKRLSRQLAERQSHARILRELAMIDSLTGLYNRRFAEQRLASEVARSARKGHPLTVIAFDLDEFKLINDTHGHAAGDMALQAFAAALCRAVREGDLAVRLGGDEFLVILPECNLAQSEMVLKRIGDVKFSFERHRSPVKYSAGWKEYASGDTPESLLAAADEALYHNKRSSKAPVPPTEVPA